MATGDFSIKVSPQELSIKSEQMRTEKANIQNILQSVTDEVNSLQNVYMSESGETFRARYHQLSDDIENILRTVEDHIQDLNEVAQIYSETMDRTKSNAEGLPTDGVFL